MKEELTEELRCDGDMATLRCAECGLTQGDGKQLEAHVATLHLDWVPFKCHFCDAYYPTELFVRDHLHNAHPNLPTMMAYKVNDEKKFKLEQIMRSSVENSRSAFESQKRKSQPQTSNDSKKVHRLSPFEFCSPNLPNNASNQGDTPTHSGLNFSALLQHNRVAQGQPSSNRSSSKAPATVVKSEPAPPCAAPQLSTSSEVSKSAGGANGEKQGRRRWCSLCSKESTCATLARHVWQHHIQLSTFQCLYCDHSNYQANTMRRHVSALHPSKKPEFTDNRSKCWAEFAELYEQCFRSKPTKLAQPLEGALSSTSEPSPEVASSDSSEPAETSASHPPAEADSNCFSVEVLNSYLRDSSEASDRSTASSPAAEMTAENEAAMSDELPQSESVSPAAVCCSLCDWSLDGWAGKTQLHLRRVTGQHVADKHMTMKEANCPECDYSGRRETVGRHMVAMHKNTNKFKITNSQFRPEFFKMRLKCFPPQGKPKHNAVVPLSPAKEAEPAPIPVVEKQAPRKRKAEESEAGGTSRQEKKKTDRQGCGEGRVCCQLCRADVNNKCGSTTYHVWKVHVRELAFECPYCSIRKANTSLQAGDMLQHVRRNHPDKPERIIDRKQQLTPQMKQLRQECFPNLL